MTRSRTIRSLFLSWTVLLAAAWLTAPGQAADSTPPAPDLSGFRTVATATTTEISKTPAAAPGQSGYLGIHAAIDHRGKLVVEEVEAGSPAAQAGLRAGDVLLKLGEQAVRSPEALRELLQSRAPGEVVRVAVERRKKKLEVTATLAATSRPRKVPSRPAMLGVQIGEADGGEGAPIRQVVPDSPAAGAGLKVGDVLLKINGTLLTNAALLGDSVAEKEPGETMTLTLRREGKEVELKVQLAEAPSRGRGGPDREDRSVWKKDVYRLAVVAVEYPDVKHNPAITLKDWEDAHFSKGSYVSRNSATGQPVYGSLNDYYLEQSCGALRVEGRVFDWVEVSKKRADYAQGTGSSRTGLLAEALDVLHAREGSEALKEFDGVFFLYAGGRFQTNRGGLYWPHRASVSYQGRRLPYFIVPEGGNEMSNISVICHEFGHMLGLPDLYARPENPGSEGLGIWCCMSNQAGSGRPQHMSAWCKEQLGWLKPTVIDPTIKQKLVLAPIENSATECFKVLIRRDGSEYLLLENRRKTGFDQSLPAEGLLIWRIVARRPILEESHGVDGPAGPRVFTTSVPYPSAANNAYTPYTTPSSRSQLGGGLPVYLTNIRQLPDGRVAFYVGYDFQ
jgi:M6 family metalloprotease-like protein